ncbi:MAG TPA: hypothetical protein VFV00_17350 [Acidimicrobiales bacterium]|nr:hypothetical protein [Acidimicrobiales bacterium]
MNVLAVAALSLIVVTFGAGFGSTRSHAAPAQTPADPWEGSSFTSPSSYATTSDAVFSGVFRHTPSAPISKVTLHVEFSSTDSPSAGCRPAPSDQTQTYETTTSPPTVDTTPDTTDPSTPTTQEPKQSSEVEFSFQVPFTCNGVYDATATAVIEDPTGDVPPPLHKSISLVGVRVAVAPPMPTSITATDAGNHTVNVAWGAPASYAGSGKPPPDFIGYRVSRKDGSGSFSAIANTAPDALTFADSSIPASGGAFVYEVEAVRKFASSAPLATNGALDISPPGAAAGHGSGSTGGGGGAAAPAPATTDPGAGGTGTAYYDSLADEGAEPGSGALAAPDGGAVQRFSGKDGAGLLKPFAAAMNLGVWAGLLLFLTRRAAKAERAALLGVELEHTP